MSNIDEVFESVKVIDDKVDTLLKWSGAIDERCKNHLTETRDLKKTLFENPSGIVAKVNRLWNGQKERAKWKEWLMRILGMVIGAGIIGLVLWLLSLFKQIES